MPSEHDLEKNLITLLELVGFDVVKMSQPKPFLGTPGIPDLYIRHPKREIQAWVEVKLPYNSPSDHQAEWHKTEREAGGTVEVIKSEEELADWLGEQFGIELEVN